MPGPLTADQLDALVDVDPLQLRDAAIALLGERDRLAEQVKRAEAVCVLLGWTPSPQDTDRQKALHQLWSEWAATKPDGFIGPAAHPELSDEVIERLARKRDEIRARTLAAIRDTEAGR